MKIAILGAGLGGLCSAHHLSKLCIEGLEIHIYEKNETVGGECRGKFLNETQNPDEYIEYCWHAIGGSYLYLLQLFKEINLPSGETLYEHIKPIHNYWYLFNDKTPYHEEENNFLTTFSFRKGPASFSYSDYIFLYFTQLYIKMMPESWLEKYQKITWREYCSKLSPIAKRWIVDSTSIYMGMDYKNLDAYTILKMIRNNIKGQKEGDFFFLDGPYNSLWFDNWVNNLKSSGVQFHLGKEIISLRKKDESMYSYSKDNKIKSIILNTGEEIVADIYINSMDVHNFKNFNCNADWYLLSSYSYQLQEQVSFHFKKPIKIKADNNFLQHKKPSVMILSDSPWFLMIRIESTVYKNINGEILATGIGIWDRPGINGKKAVNCSIEEIKKEVWDQIKMSCKNNLIYEDETIVENPETVYSWPTYKYKKEKLTSSEPKFSNNIYTYPLRPKNKDENISNLWHSNAYVKTDSVIYCMESAAEAASKTVNEIAKKLKVKEPCLLFKKEEPHLSIKIIRFLLEYIFKLPPFCWI